MSVTTDDIEAALKGIDTALAEIPKVAQAGLWEAGLKIIRQAMKKTPVDVGNLRASAYVRAAAKTKLPQPGFTGEGEVPTDPLPPVGVEVGFYAEYALAVHEMVGQKLKGQPRANFGKTKEGVEFGGGSGKGTYWETGEPKFLESVVIANRQKIIDIVTQRSLKAAEGPAK